MRSIKLSKTGLNKLRSNQLELKHQDFEGSIKSIPPGEWFYFEGQHPEKWIGFINPQVDEKFICAYAIEKNVEGTTANPEEIISKNLETAIRKRESVLGYEKNSRLFFGVNDGIPGLIIDQFENAIIIQINVAGIDKYRDFISSFLEKRLNRKAFLLDNPRYREKEFLPIYDSPTLPDIEIQENGLRYKIRSEVLQKVGFYYDHRENRLQLMNFLERFNRTYERGLDLFSYVGAWGCSALKKNVKKVDFVDQGDFFHELSVSLESNGFYDRGIFYRQDVFKFLDEQISKKTNYDLILCDPPAFAKSASQKSQALDGYTKLHRKVFKLLGPSSLVAFSSCTHYVSHEEFQKNVLLAAQKENRKIQLLYSGMQGFDHPVSTQSDRSNYIKSYFYIVE